MKLPHHSEANVSHAIPSLLLQIFGISVMNFKNIPNRIGSSMVIVVGIGGVVMVLVALLAMANGLQATMQGSGHDDRVIILRDGANSEINGNITFQQANVIRNKPGIMALRGEPIIAGETFVSVNVPKRNTGDDAYVSFRGVSEQSFIVRPEVEISAGRVLNFGKFELLVGRGIADQFLGLEIGKTITLRNTKWKIVGHFSSRGSLNESELWTDVLMLNAVFGRGSTFSSMAAQLQSTLSFSELDAAILDDRRLTSKVHRESDFYRAQSANTNQLILSVATVVSSIMALGAIFAVLNTMYAAVSSRSVEIGTLRALGFGNTAIIVSVLLESLLLALVGGSLGATLCYLFFNGYTVSTIGTTTQVSFNFVVNGQLMWAGVLMACILGVLGGIFPSMSAVRQPITVVLRGA